MNRNKALLAIALLVSGFHYYLRAEANPIQTNLTAEQKKLYQDVEAKRKALVDAKTTNQAPQKRRQLMLEYAKVLQIKQKHEATLRQGK